MDSAQSREQEDTFALYDRVENSQARSPFSDEEKIGDFIIELIFEVCKRRGVTPSTPLGDALYETIKGLLYFDGLLLELPNRSTISKLTIEEGVHIRAAWKRHLHFLDDHERLTVIWRDKLVWLFSGMLEHFPLSVFTDIDELGTPANDSIELPEARTCDICDNLPEMLDRLMFTFYDVDVVNAHLFDPLRERFDDNAYRVSGIPPEILHDTTQNIIMPTQNKNTSPEYLIDGYLHGTPFHSFFYHMLPYTTNTNSTSENFDINEGIKIPIGIHQYNTFYFRLGHGVTNYHAIVGGRSGKGKTIFLDNIIARATNIYSPDELRFVLLDMKGIEFNEYKNAPHVQAFCSSSNPENGMKIIEFLKNELKNREALFNSVEASNIVEYKNKTGESMPRLLVVIDEFQNLFTGNYKTDEVVEDVLIKKILRIGRAFGVHLLCCTQSLGDGVRSSFLNNIPLRIAFQMTQDQSRSFLSIRNTEAESLQVGEAIYNEQDGVLNENFLVIIDHLQTVDVQKLIMEFVNSGKSYQSFEKLIVGK